MDDTDRDESRITKFKGNDGEDFELWSLRLNAVLEGKDLAEVLTEEAREEAQEFHDEIRKKKIRKARAIIINALGDKPLRVVQTATGPKDMMEKLSERYAASTTANKIAVLTSLIHTRYDREKNMGEYLSEMESMFNKLAAMKLPIAPELQVAILLVSMTAEESLSGTVSAIKTMDESRATWEYVSGRLIEEVRSQKLAENSDGLGTIAAAALIPRGPRGLHKSQIRCYRCNRKGHIARNCRTKLKNEQEESTNNNEEEDEPTVRAAVAMDKKGGSDFIMDSGCTEHISNKSENFTKIENITPIRVYLANNFVVEAKQKGMVSIDIYRSDRGRTKTTRLALSNVLYIPEASVNLISCTQLDKYGISTLFQNGKCELLDREQKNVCIGYAIERKADKLFVLEGNVVKSKKKINIACTTNTDVTSGIDLWHQRLGHISKDVVQKMADGMVEGLSTEDKAQNIECIPCVEAKQTKMPSTGTIVKGEIHHAIHSDMIGPIKPQSLGGAKYIICFMVEASRLSKVYVVRRKSDLYTCFKEFQAWLERATDVLIKSVHSDNAKEYIRLGDYLKEEGIVQSFSTAYTPQSNGLAERFNRTLLDKVRVMLRSASLPMKFWGEAALHGSYLHNVTSGKPNDSMTPYEMTYNKKPDLSKLRIFGCAAYVHEPKERRAWKLSQRGNEGILLGHENGMYRVWNTKTLQVSISKHVMFKEDLFPAEKIFDTTETDEEGDSETSIFMNEPLKDNEQGPSVVTVQPNSETDGPSNSENAPAVVTPRYPTRERREPDRYVANAARRGDMGDTDDNPTLRVAMQSKESKEWKKAIDDELCSLKGSGTWEIVKRPNNVHVLHCMWLLKKKRTADGKFSRYKARLVVCGNEDDVPSALTFAPVVDFTVVRLTLSLAKQDGWLIHQVDYSNAFLQGDLERVVYMYVPEMMAGYWNGKVCLLRKSLYGLKEAPRIWYDLLSNDLQSIGLKPMTSAPCVFRANGIMVLCYVDDLLVMAEDEKKMAVLKEKLAEKLPANDMGTATDFLGMKLIHEEDGIIITQNKYIEGLISKLGLSNCRTSIIPCDPNIDLSTPGDEEADAEFEYRSIVGSLMYLATHTRPDIFVATSMLARHVENPSKKHQQAIVKLVKYLKGTRNHGLKLTAGEGDQLSAYVDSNWAGEPGAGRRSRTGFVLLYGASLIHYTSSLQKGITLSSTEAEYVALSDATKMIIWVRRILEEFGKKQERTLVGEDNAGAFKWSNGHVAEDYRRSRHVDVKYHHVREHVAAETMKLVKVGTNEMVADFLTKALQSVGLRKAMEALNVVECMREKGTEGNVKEV